MLGDDKGLEVVAKLIAAQANVFAKASLEPISRQAAREGAMEAVAGSYVSNTHMLISCALHLACLWQPGFCVLKRCDHDH